MARARNIKPGLFKNEILGEADPVYSLLFIGLWTLADKEGRLENRPKRIRAEVFPYRFDLDVSKGLTWLNNESFITIYGFGGDSYIQVNNWKRHQTPHHKEVDSIIPSVDEVKKTIEKQKVTQEQTKHESSMNQDQAKENASCPTDSLNRIPDSLNLEREQRNADAPPPQEQKPPATPKQKRGTRLPDDWVLTADYLEAARNIRPDLLPVIDTVANKFADFWHAKTGANATKLDWLATWRNWLRNEKQITGGSNGPHQPIDFDNTGWADGIEFSESGPPYPDGQ